MRDIEEIKAKIKELYESGIEIHVNVHSKKPKIDVNDANAHITGIYRNLFTIETQDNGLKKQYTVQYTDLFIGKVKILELEKQSD